MESGKSLKSRLMSLKRTLMAWATSMTWIAVLQIYHPELTLIWLKHRFRQLRNLAGALLVLLGLLMIAGGFGLSACAPKMQAPKLELDQKLRGPCARPALPPKRPAEASAEELLLDTSAFSVRQEAALNVCEAKGVAKEQVIDAYNKAIEKQQKRFWEFWK